MRRNVGGYMGKIKKYIEEKDNINEIIFCWCICLVIWGLPVGVLLGTKIHFLFFVINLMIMLAVSWIKNRKILMKKDIIPLAPVVIIFLIDFLFRKNSYTFSTYYIFIRKCYIPYYFFNRTKNIKEMFKYFALFSKVSIIIFLFDAILDYHFTSNYMTYGFTIMLPAFFSIYMYHFIEKKETDLLYLIICLLGIFIYSNRTCMLSVICIFIFSSKMVIMELKNRHEEINENSKKTKYYKNGLVILLLIISFTVNYSIMYIEKNHEVIVAQIHESLQNMKKVKTKDEKTVENEVRNDNIDKSVNENKSSKSGDSIMTFNSYSLTKYKEATEGKKNTILSGRGKIYKKAISVIKDTVFSSCWAFLFGNGTGYFRSCNDGIYTHNMLLDFIIEYGLCGFLFGVTVIAYCVVQLFKHYKDKEYYMFGIYWLFLAFPRLLLSLYFQEETTIWIFIAFILTCYPINLKQYFKKAE